MAQYELGFRDYWRIVRRRWQVVVLVALGTASLAVYYNNAQTPVYQASAAVRVERPKSLAGNLMDAMTTTYYENPLVTEAQVLGGRLVAEEVTRRLGLVDEAQDPEAFQEAVSSVQGSIFAEPMRNTSILSIVVTSFDADRAWRVANLAVEVYVEQNLQQKNRQARKVREFIESQLTSTAARLHEAEEQQRRLRERGVSGLAVALQEHLIEIQKQHSDMLTRATALHPDVERLATQIQEIQAQLRSLPQDEMEFARISREVKVSEETYTNLRSKLEEARIAEAEKIEDVRIVNSATRPTAPIRPNKQMGYVIGGILGLMLGLVMAFVLENLDTSLGTIEDVESLLQVPVLGVVPHVRTVHAQADTRRPWWTKLLGLPASASGAPQLDLFAHFYPTTPETEAFRTLRTNLKLGEQRKVLMITSSGPREGKTSIVANLGVVIGQAGSRVLLIASDLRKPQLAKAFGIRRDPGLSELLSGAVTANQVIRGFADFAMGKLGFSGTMQTPGLDNVSVLSSGHIPPNPSELIGSKAMQDMLTELRGQYDTIILDAPPVLPIADAMQLAPYVDGVILVYEVGRTARAAIARSKVQIESAGGKVIGVILNHVRPETHYPAYYYYRYRYYERDKSETAAEQPTAGG